MWKEHPLLFNFPSPGWTFYKYSVPRQSVAFSFLKSCLSMQPTCVFGLQKTSCLNLADVCFGQGIVYSY